MRFVAGRVHRGGEPGRGAVAKLLLAGAPMRMAGVFLAEMQLPGAHRCVMAVRAVAQKHREEASGKRVQDWQPRARLASGFTIRRRVELVLDELMHDGQADAGLFLFGWCAEGVHLVYYFHWDAEDSVQLFVCGGVVVAEEPYYCNELVVGYLTEWLVVSLV